VKPRGEKPVPPEALQAAKLSHVPGVTIAEACERFGVTKAAIARARRLPSVQPTVAELALAALTNNGTRDAGALADLERVASWIDHVNHDGSTAESVRTLLDPFVAAGQLVFEGDRWQFRGDWP
jgi:hypothetical protein